MRKHRKIVLLVVLALIFTFSSQSYSADPAGEVIAVKKDVFRIRGESRDNAEARMDLLMKDAVETAGESRTKLFFSDDSILNLGELSKVKIEEYMYSPEKQRSKSIYRLIDGTIKVVVGRSDLEVHTASTVASARGTSFMIKSKELPPEACESKSDKEISSRELEGRKIKCTETCIYVLDSKVEWKLKKDAKTEKTKNDIVIIGQDEYYCLIGDSFVMTDIDVQMMAKWKKEFPVYATIIPQKGELPAFAPEPPVTFDVSGDTPGDSPVDQMPAVSPVDQMPAVIVDDLKQGDFERIDIRP